MKSTGAPTKSAGPRVRAFRLTPEGLAWLGATLLVGGVGWWKSLYALYLLGLFMSALLGMNAVLARRQVRRVTATRAPGPPVFAGEDARVLVRLRNVRSGPATVGVAESPGADGAAWFVDGLPAGGELDCERRRVFRTRGRYGAPPRIHSGFPLGFIRCERAGAVGGETVVLPAVGRADPDGMFRWLSRHAGGGAQARRVVRRATTEPADVRGVRPYRPGDGVRSVHWRSSARRGELMVREYDTAPALDLFLVVEPYLPANPTAADRVRLEAALSLAATVVRCWCRDAGTRLTVLVLGPDAVAVAGPPTEAFARDALVPLAGVVGSATFDPPDPSAFGSALARSARVVVSSRPDGTTATALGRLTGKPFVSLDPAVPLPWYTPPSV